MHVQPWSTFLTTAIWLQSALSRPTGDMILESRDHVECQPNGQCFIMKTCDNDFTVAAGSDPNTPGSQPATPPQTFAGSRPRDALIAVKDVVEPAASGTPGATSQTKRSSNPDSDSDLPFLNLNSKRQTSSSGPPKWCALGSNLYITITPTYSPDRIDPKQIGLLLNTTVDNLRSYISTAGNGPVAPPPEPGSTQNTSSQAQGALASASLTSSPEGNANTAGLSPIFSVAPGGPGSDALTAYNGSPGGIEWVELLLAVLTLNDYCTKQPKGCGLVQVSIIVGATQVGKMAIS